MFPSFRFMFFNSLFHFLITCPSCGRTGKARPSTTSHVCAACKTPLRPVTEADPLAPSSSARVEPGAAPAGSTPAANPPSTGATRPDAGTPGTGAYAGLTWDGKGWVGETTVQGQKNGTGVASLIIGIFAVLLCGGGFILPLLAITFGWTGMKRAKQGLASNGGVAKAGFILGLVAAGISALLGILYLLALISDSNLNNY